MFGDQPVADAGDGRAALSVAVVDVDRDVALGVEPHRAVVHVRRTDPQDAVVDEHHLGMDVDRCPAGGDRMIEAKAAVPVTLAQRLDQPGARRVHRDRLQPALGGVRVDEHDLGAVRLVEPLRHGLGDAARGEILAFGVDETARRGDLAEEERLDLEHGRAVRHRRLGAGDLELDFVEVDGEFGRPAVADPGDRLQMLAARPRPARAADVAERRRRRTFDRARGVVPRLVGPATAIDATGILVEVDARVPASAGHVDPAAEGEAVVDADDLLVMRCAGRMVAVEFDVDAGLAHPLEDREERRAAHRGLERAEIPAQQIDLQLRLALEEPEHEVADGLRLTRLARAVGKADARVEVPADEHDPPLRPQHRRAQQSEIVIGVDDDREAVGARARHDGHAPPAAMWLSMPAILAHGWLRGH